MGLTVTILIEKFALAVNDQVFIDLIHYELIKAIELVVTFIR